MNFMPRTCPDFATIIEVAFTGPEIRFRYETSLPNPRLLSSSQRQAVPPDDSQPYPVPRSDRQMPNRHRLMLRNNIEPESPQQQRNQQHPFCHSKACTCANTRPAGERHIGFSSAHPPRLGSPARRIKGIRLRPQSFVPVQMPWRQHDLRAHPDSPLAECLR